MAYVLPMYVNVERSRVSSLKSFAYIYAYHLSGGSHLGRMHGYDFSRPGTKAQLIVT